MLRTFNYKIFFQLIFYISFVSCQLSSDFDQTNAVGVSPCIKGCGKDHTTCECFLTIQHRLTMMLDDSLILVNAGDLMTYKNVPLTEQDRKEVITADGYDSRLVITINRQFPGPRITAYENQKLIIHVRNLMNTDTFTLHWHGMEQNGSPESDGVAFVTQNPVLPGHTFTYEFTAKPHGTSFYHSHIGDQRTMVVWTSYHL